MELKDMTLEEKIKAVQDSAKRIEDELFHSEKAPLEDDDWEFGEYDCSPIWE